MITFSLSSGISDVDFTRLFAGSITDMDAGNYPWHYFPDVVTFEEKKAHIKACFDAILARDDGFVWQVDVDGQVMMFNAGYRDGAHVRWVMGLVAQDDAGSKAYLYDPDYVSGRNAFWAEQGLTGWTMETAGGNTPLLAHMRNKVTAGAMGVPVVEVDIMEPLVLRDIEIGTTPE